MDDIFIFDSYFIEYGFLFFLITDFSDYTDFLISVKSVIILFMDSVICFYDN